MRLIVRPVDHHRIDQHIVDQIENSLEIWSTLIDLGELCKVTFLCLLPTAQCANTLENIPHIPLRAALSVGEEFPAISSSPNDGLYITALH